MLGVVLLMGLVAAAGGILWWTGVDRKQQGGDKNVIGQLDDPAVIEVSPVPADDDGGSWPDACDPALVAAMEVFGGHIDPALRSGLVVGKEAMLPEILADSADGQPAGRRFSLSAVSPVGTEAGAGIAAFRVGLGAADDGAAPSALAVWRMGTHHPPLLDWATWAQTANGTLAAFFERHQPGETIVARVILSAAEGAPGRVAVDGLAEDGARRVAEIARSGTLAYRIADGLARLEPRLATVELRFGDGFSDYANPLEAPLQIAKLRCWGLISIPGSDAALAMVAERTPDPVPLTSGSSRKSESGQGGFPR
ncbi:hypothetical protein BH23VER1_BH23VER1_02410 [soil metagenome]